MIGNKALRGQSVGCSVGCLRCGRRHGQVVGSETTGKGGTLINIEILDDSLVPKLALCTKVYKNMSLHRTLEDLDRRNIQCRKDLELGSSSGRCSFHGLDNDERS